MPYIFTPNVVRYTIEIPENDFDNILTYEKDMPAEKCLFDILNKQGLAHDIDYDGHFGNYIFISMYYDDDTPIERNNIINLIKKQAIKAEKYIDNL